LYEIAVPYSEINKLFRAKKDIRLDITYEGTHMLLPIVSIDNNKATYSGSNGVIELTVYQYSNNEVVVKSKKLGSDNDIKAVTNRVNNIENDIGEAIPYITQAQHGQIPVVEEVDESGKPLNWGVIDKEPQYKLIRYGTSNTPITSIMMSDIRVSSFILYISCPIGESAVSGGVGIFMGEDEQIYSPWFNNMCSTSEERNAMVRGYIRNGIAFVESVAPATANATQNRNINCSPMLIKGDKPFTKVRFNTSGGKELPKGTKFELWGIDYDG
jgi:hypothetical protein